MQTWQNFFDNINSNTNRRRDAQNKIKKYTLSEMRDLMQWFFDTLMSSVWKYWIISVKQDMWEMELIITLENTEKYMISFERGVSNMKLMIYKIIYWDNREDTLKFQFCAKPEIDEIIQKIHTFSWTNKVINETKNKVWNQL